MRKIDSILEKISNVLLNISIWLVLVLIILICYDVFARYFFNSPVEWIYEMSYIIGAFIAVFGFSQLVIDDGNVRVDMFFANFTRKIQLLIDIAFGAIIFIPTYGMVLLAIAKNGIYAYVTQEVSVVTTWYPLLWPIKLGVFIGFSVFFIQLVLITIKNIIELKEILKGGEA